MEDPVEALRRSEARYRSLVEATAVDVWVTSPDGQLTTDLPRWRETSRQSEQEVLGDGWLDAIHPDDREHTAATWRRAVASSSTHDVAYRIRPVRGEIGPEDERVLLVRGVPVRAADGTILEWVGVTLDITDGRRQALEREQLTEQARAAAGRTQRLQRVAARLSRSVRIADIVEAVLDEAHNGVGASGGGLSLLDETGTRLRYQVLNGYDPDVKAQWADISIDTTSPGPEVLRTGEPLFISGADQLVARFPTPEIERFVRLSQEQAWARLPISTTGRPFGVLALGFVEERDWNDEERTFLLALADLAAQAVERARSYERERSTAMLLQRSMLPDRLPDVAGLRIAGTYQPAGGDVDVSGDWYDAFTVHGDRLALVVGDVRGKGALAASVMGRVRNSLRGYAALDPDPALVLRRLDVLAETFDDDEEIVTVAYAVLDPVSGRLEHASAGHLPSVLLYSDGSTAELTGGRGMPLGVGRSSRDTAVAVLAPGCTLLMITDGLVEARDRSLIEGYAALDVALAEVPSRDGALDVDQVGAHLLSRLVRDELDDDVTVLTVHRVAVGDDAGSQVELALPPELTSASVARRFVQRVLADWSLSDMEDAATLAVSELVTNALVHAGTDAVLQLRQRHGRLRISVSDQAGDVLTRPRDADDEATNGRGLALVAAVASRWGTDQHGDGGKTVWLEIDPV